MIYLALAFMAVWVLATLYLFYMSRKQNSLELEMKTLEEMVTESTARGSD
jgi:CcmD family protein